MIKEDTTKFNPRYKDIATELRVKIEQGHWSTGMMIPSRKSLSQEYQVGMGTIQSAILLLVTEGLLQSDDRRGTLVTQNLSTRYALHRPPVAASQTTSATMGVLCGFDLPNSQDQWHHHLFHGMEKVLSQEHCTTCFYNYYTADGVMIPIEEAVAALVSQGVSVIAAVTVHSTPEEINDIHAAAGEHGIPLVFINSSALHRPVPHVYYDNTYGGYAAAQHLIERGYQDLVFVAPMDADWVNDRLAGVRHALKDAKLGETCLRVINEGQTPYVPGDFIRMRGYAAAQTLFATGDSGFGVIAANDHTAAGFLEAAAKTDRKAGKHFGLISFDDLPKSRHLGLTSLAPPFAEMGEAAARLMLSIIQGQDMTTQICLRSHLMARAPTAPHTHSLSPSLERNITS